jgi:hypothetical protein
MIEVILMILAWRKGWKGYSLLPLGCAVGVALVLSSMNAPMTAAIPVDLMAIVALIVIIKQPPQARNQLLTK